MDFIINELSLHSQYRDIDDFSSTGAVSLNGILNELRMLNTSILLKKTTLHERKVTASDSLYSVLCGIPSRTNDCIRRMKGLMASLFNGPYWDTKPKQNVNSTYIMTNADGIFKDVSGSSIAEAQARTACIISFYPSDFTSSHLHVRIKGDIAEHTVCNIFQQGACRDILLSKKIIGYEEYFNGKYSKLNFTHISKKYGFNLLDHTNVELFKETFHMFDSLSWQEMPSHAGLDYKPFNKNTNTKDYFTPEQWSTGIYKFRASKKFRCFGYRQGDVFFVIRIDLEHTLSDKG